MKNSIKLKRGRPKTGRLLYRYWLKESCGAAITAKARAAGYKRDADYLENEFSLK